MTDENYKPFDTRPDDVAASNWKNRFLVSSKLTPINYKAFRNFCKTNNYSYSSGINYLISRYLPEHNV
tara:strand:+ start:187 stop:390 length:204 start_codon:yes stop_codon:yes gene_type:complete